MGILPILLIIQRIAGQVKGECSRDVDPCSNDVYVTLDEPTRSTGYNGTVSTVESDVSLPQNWYRSISFAGGDMPTSPVSTLQCNALAPIYLSDSLPSASAGIVDLNACVSYLDNDCDSTYMIPVQNCTDFNVYCLSPVVDAYERYCMGSEVQCETGYSSETGFTPCEEINAVAQGDCSQNIDPCDSEYYTTLDNPTRSILYNVTDMPENDYNLTELWYRIVSGAGGDMPTHPVFTSQCNADAPIYLRGDLPAASDGIVNMTGCASHLNDNCVRYYVLPVKNCGEYNVYCLPPVAVTLDRYCFGTELECQDGYTSGTGFSPGCVLIDSDEDLNESDKQGKKKSTCEMVCGIAIAISITVIAGTAAIVVTAIACNTKKKRLISSAHPRLVALASSQQNDFSITHGMSPPLPYNELMNDGKTKSLNRPENGNLLKSTATNHTSDPDGRALTPV